MKANPVLERANVKVTTVTPTSITTSEKLKFFEYLYDYRDNTIILLNQNEWLDFLKRKRLYEDYIKLLSQDLSAPRRNKKNIDLFSWVANKIGKHSLSEQHLGKAIKKRVDVSSFKGKAPSNDLKPCVTSLDKPYLPGSTLKGVIRSAIIWYALQKDEVLRTKCKNEVLPVLHERNIKKASKRPARNVDKKVFVKLKNGDGTFLNDSLGSIMRGISISDMHSTEVVNTCFTQKVDISVDGRKESAISVFYESILPKQHFTGSILIDTSITGNLGINSIEQLLSIVESYTDYVMAYLTKHFHSLKKGDVIDGNSITAFIGNNVGFLYKTLWLSILDEHEINGVVKNILDNLFRNKGHYKNSDVSPRVLKAFHYHGKHILSGGVKIESL